MASGQENNASFCSEQTAASESSRAKSSHNYEEETFYRNCRASYLAIFKSSLENIKSKEQLCLVLQQAGRNPSWKTVNKYWTLHTTSLNFDDFCFILKKEPPVQKTELFKAFAKMDASNDGYILHSELRNILTTKGEKMTLEEINAITELAEVNNDGKFDYYKFCKLYMTTNEQCLKNAVEKLEVDSKLKRQQFGNQIETFSEMAKSPDSKPKTARKTEARPMRKGGHCKSSLRPSSAPSCNISLTSTISMGASSNKKSKLIEENAVKEWQCAYSKGCFFLEDNDEIVTHKYKLFLPQRSTVCITIKPIRFGQMEGKCFPWLAVDTALYILKENETEEKLKVVNFTELRNKEAFGWRGELGAGVYWVIPFTTGCRFKKMKKQIGEEAKLIYEDGDGCLALTKEFRVALSEIFEMIDLDGNGFLSLEEYNFFEMRTSGEKCDEEAWAICKHAVLHLEGVKEQRSFVPAIPANLTFSKELHEDKNEGPKSDISGTTRFDLYTALQDNLTPTEQFITKLENFETKNNELTKQGFMDLNLMEASDRGGNLSDLWITLMSMGYNKAMELTEACPFSIHIYSEKCKPQIKPVCLETGGGQLNKAICMNVVNKGDAKPMDNSENVIIHTYKSDTRITSIIENKTEGKTVIHLNNEKSKNCVNNRGLNAFAIEVAPKSMMVSQHVMPLNEQEEWIYNCVYSVLV